MEHVFPNPWLLGVGLTLLAYLLGLGVKRLLCTRLSPLLGRSRTKWDDIFVTTMERTSHIFLLGLAVYLTYRYVPQLRRHAPLVNRGFFIVCMLQLFLWLNTLINLWIQSFIHRKTRKNPAAASSISIIQLMAKVITLSFVALFTLHNLGINIVTLIAGLGVGGIAIALALQKVLGDLFASLSIIMDKPFMVGDFIILDQYLGEVEKIGLRTTQIRGLGGEQVIVSNSDLLGSRIRNFKRMQERRVLFTIGLSLDTEPEALRQAVDIVTGVLKDRKLVRFDRCHFMDVGRSWLDIEGVYFVLSDDFNVYRDVHQEILFEVLRLFRQHGIRLAYPTQNMNLGPPELFQRLEALPAGEGRPADRRSMS